MNAVMFLTIRSAHILLAALWIGATVFGSALLMPAVEATGASGGQVMAKLNRHGLHIYMTAIAATTLATGIYLLWHFTGGFDASVTSSHAGLVFGIGGTAGILAGIIGGAVVGRSAKKLTGLFSHAVTEADDHVHRGLLRQAETLRRRMKIGTRAVIVLQTLALLFMSVGHYV